MENQLYPDFTFVDSFGALCDSERDSDDVFHPGTSGDGLPHTGGISSFTPSYTYGGILPESFSPTLTAVAFAIPQESIPPDHDAPNCSVPAITMAPDTHLAAAAGPHVTHNTGELGGETRGCPTNVSGDAQSYSCPTCDKGMSQAQCIGSVPNVRWA